MTSAAPSAVTVGDKNLQFSFSFRTPSQALSVANELSTYCDEPLDACTAISELLINAVEHGNLGIGGELKEKLLREERLVPEIERRLTTAPWDSRIARAEFRLTKDRLIVTIEDEGEGFDWHSLPKEPDFSRLNGRGVPMAMALFFDEITFRQRGNVCVATKHF